MYQIVGVETRGEIIYSKVRFLCWTDPIEIANFTPPDEEEQVVEGTDVQAVNQKQLDAFVEEASVDMKPIGIKPSPIQPEPIQEETQG